MAARLAAEPGFEERFGAVAPALVLPGSAVHAGTKARASGVTVLGVDSRFAAVYGHGEGAGLDLTPRAGQAFPPVAVNAALARELGAAVGDEVLLSFPRPSEVPRDTVLASKDAADALDTLRLTVAQVLPDAGIGRFSLAPHQAAPLNAFVGLAALQQAVGARERVNALLVGGGRAGAAEGETGAARPRRRLAAGADPG